MLCHSTAMAAKRIERVVSLVATIILLLLALASFARAQSATGEIDILVVDAKTQVPIGNARTILLGAQTANTLTTASGLIRFTDVPIGIYRVRVQHPGYDAGITPEFDVLPDRAVEVHLELDVRPPSSVGAGATNGRSNGAGGAVTNLKVIATVTVHPRVSITSTDINANSPVRRLSDSLTDALDKIAGVTVTTDATDPNSAVTISLHNQDESQTSLSLDGIPLSAPGSAGNLRSIGTDLFSGSSTSFSPSAGGLGGSVGFRTLEPTQSLQVRGSGTTGTFDRSNYSFATTGSVGSLGFALQHTGRTANSPLTFQDYQDDSSLTYAHGGESETLGDLVKLRYRVGDDRTTISAAALTTNRDAYAICARDVTVLPCGIGPDNRTYGRYGLAYATVASLVGNVQTNFSAYANSSTQTTNDANRYILEPGNGCQAGGPGQPTLIDCDPTLDPSLAQNDTTTRGVAYGASIAQGNHTFSLSGTTYASISQSVPVAGSAFETAFTNAASSTTYRFADAIKSNDQVTITPQVSFADTSGLGSSFLGGVGTTWSPHQADAYALSLNVGSSQPNLSANRSFSDPNSARFDCQGGTAIVSGPGDTGTGQRQSATSLNGTWAHQFQGGATINMDVFSQLQSGQLITAAIDEPATYFASVPGFITAVDQAYQEASVCGASAPLPAVYVQESVAGTTRLYQGFDINGRFALSPYITILPTYSLNRAVLTAASTRLEDGPTTTIVGSQLPGRPLHRAGFTVDGLLPRSGLELLANAQYTGANNNQNLGPYVNVSFGASHKFGAGQVTLFENNAFNTYGGDFAGDAFAQPLPLSNGQMFQTTATPLTPRSLYLSYAVVLGGPAPGPAFAAFAKPMRTAQLGPQPEASATPRPRLRLTPFPPPPGVDPLSIATGRPTCDTDAQAAGKPLFDGLRAYVTAYEAGATPPPVPNTTVTAIRESVNPAVPYYLVIRPNFPRPVGAPAGDAGPRARGFGGGGGDGGPGAGGPGEGAPPPGPPPGGDAGPVTNLRSGEGTPGPGGQRRGGGFASSPVFVAFRGFISCSYVSVFTAAQAKADGIVLEGGRPALLYVPKTGFVFVQPPQLPAGGGSLKAAQ
ncbi:MAG TPA: TonB-dependent receptor, partial [Candidatus Baltobacteraceae bacterium]